MYPLPNKIDSQLAFKIVIFFKKICTELHFVNVPVVKISDIQSSAKSKTVIRNEDIKSKLFQLYFRNKQTTNKCIECT